jgi:putative phage-type endonuclease
MTAVALPLIQGTPEWVAARGEGIGSSDAPIIAGERAGLLELWALKAGLIDRPEIDADTQRLFDWGHRLEDDIAEAYTAETDRPLRRVNRMLAHPAWPIARASLDRVSARRGERRIVEIKNTRSLRWEQGEPVPGDVQAQVQHQLWVTGYDVADVAVLVAGSDFRIIEVQRDDGFIADLEYLERELWAHVESRTPPAVDGSESTRRTLARLHPRDDGTYLPATPEFEELVAHLRAAKVAAKTAADAEATVANALRAVLGDASGIEGLVTYRKNADSTRTNWPAVAMAYRERIETLVPLLVSAHQPGEILAELDSIVSIHSETVEGPRVLRLSKGATE